MAMRAARALSAMLLVMNPAMRKSWWRGVAAVMSSRMKTPKVTA